MKILANDGISFAAKERLEQAGCQVSTDKVEQAQLCDHIEKEKITALLVRSATKVRKDLVDACPSLEIIGRGGVGMDNIDVDYARSKGIEVFNTPASSSQSVAELVMMHVFNLCRFGYDSNRQMPLMGSNNFKDLKKKYGKGLELRDRTLGIVGFGRIGQQVAKYALGNGMKVIATDPVVDFATIKVDVVGTAGVQAGIRTIPFESVLTDSDIISMHLPAREDGKAVIGAKEIEMMKDGVMIINAARGGVVDEQALLDALNRGKVARAAVDVYENEPAPDEALLKHPNISLTPHIGAATVEAQNRIGDEIADFIIKYMKNKQRQKA